MTGMTPSYGGRTPMYGSQTPSYDGSRTPHYGSATPSHDGSATPGRSSAWDPANTNTPSRWVVFDWTDYYCDRSFHARDLPCSFVYIDLYKHHHHCVIPRTKMKFGDRAFCVVYRLSFLLKLWDRPTVSRVSDAVLHCISVTAAAAYVAFCKICISLTYIILCACYLNDDSMF